MAISAAAMALARCTWRVISSCSRSPPSLSGGSRQRRGLAKLIALYVGFVIAHDLIFLPAYSGLDRAMRAALARLPGRRPGRVPTINHIRAPALISGLLLIIYLPLISGKADAEYFADSGHHLEGYLRNWLLISAVLFLGSGLIYALRRRTRCGQGARDIDVAASTAGPAKIRRQNVSPGPVVCRR